MSNKTKNLTKMLLIPTLVIGGLTACGSNDGARTNNYDGARPYAYDNSTNNIPKSSTMNDQTQRTPRGQNNNSMFNVTNDLEGAQDDNTPMDDGMDFFQNGYRNNGAKTNDTTKNSKRNNMSGKHSEQDVKIARMAAATSRGIPEVEKATAVAFGKDIVVGIDVRSDTNTKDVERKVREKIEGTQSGYNVHVTSDEKLHTRVKSIEGNMGNMTNSTMNNNIMNNNTTGHPVRALGTDIADIVRDIGRTVTAPLR